MTGKKPIDRPYEGRRGGRYVRASRDETPRPEAAAAADALNETQAMPADAGETPGPETTETAKGGKPPRNRS